MYGAGGNAGASFTYDFIELFNRGNPVSMAGWSLQFASATGTGNFGASATQLTELPAVVIAPGQYFLVQEAGGTTGTPISADSVDSTPISMSGSAGKVALVTSVVTLGCNGGSTPCSPAQRAAMLDLVGYGTPVSCSVGVTSNEPADAQGHGHTSIDWEVIDAHHVRLRAERSVKGTGRVYTVTVTCTDATRNISSSSVPVVVSK